MLNSHHFWPLRHPFSSKFWNIHQNLTEPISNCFPVYLQSQKPRASLLSWFHVTIKHSKFSWFSKSIMLIQEIWNLISPLFSLLFQWVLCFISASHSAFIIYPLWGKKESASHPTLTVVREHQGCSETDFGPILASFWNEILKYRSESIGIDQKLFF